MNDIVSAAIYGLSWTISGLVGVICYFKGALNEDSNLQSIGGILLIFALIIYFLCKPKWLRDANAESTQKRLNSGVQCPNCGMHAGYRISDFDKKSSIAFWGIASSKIGKSYKCENCKHMW